MSTRTALVTGAAGGIGRALVQAFAAAGFRVVGSDIGGRPDDLPCAAWVEGDLEALVRDDTSADMLLGRLREAIGEGGLNALVNNAAAQVLGPTETLSRHDWRRTLDVNVLAPFFLVQGLLTELESAGGRVVNVSSVHARLTKPGFVAYATSKAALSGLTRALAVDLGSRIVVNAVEPAAVSTAMLRAGFEGRPEAFSRLEQCHPVGRIAQPEEIAAAVLALVQQAPGFLHGACIGIDGGIANTLHDPA